MSLSNLLVKIFPSVAENVVLLDKPWPSCTLFISICDGEKRASVVNASADTFDDAWLKVTAKCHRLVERNKLKARWIRVDWVRHAEKLTWDELEERFEKTKRNYFRHGLALDEQFHRAFLEQELNANAMLYGGGQTAHAVLNKKNFEIYAKKRYKGYAPDFSGNVYKLSAQGVYCSLEESPKLLYPSGRDAGRRIIHSLDYNDVYGVIGSGSRYLSSQVQQSGQFNYGWHPCFDRPINTYNTLRHASTTYAMLEAWEVTKDEALKASIDKALSYLVEHFIKTVHLDDGGSKAMSFLVDQGEEIKLGGNAVCLLALTKYTELTGDNAYRQLVANLAEGICYMQDPDTGAFVHVLNYPDLSVKEKFRIIYYEGEAAFGLMRTYEMTKDPRWLEMVEKAFEYFIAEEHWRAHDHWLSYCVNELTKYKPEEKYYQFGILNVAEYLDFVLNRITTFPTLLELMMAAERMIGRLRDAGNYHHLLSQIDMDKFDRALHHRAQYLLNGHFWPEQAMYFKNPEKILGSFFIRHHAFRIRIDDVEHYLSGLVAYLSTKR